MTKNKKITSINFLLFFIGWTIIFLLGADFPPPIGFIWIVLLTLLLDVIQSYYLYHYFLSRIKNRKETKLFLINSLFYLIGSLVLAILISIPNLLTIEVHYALVWIAVVTLVGVLYSIIFYIVNLLLYHVL